METLFRFNIVRDTRLSADEVDSIDLPTGSAFQQAAAAVPAGPKRREGLRNLARTFITSADFVGSVTSDAEFAWPDADGCTPSET